MSNVKKYILKLYIYTDGDWGIDNTFTDKCMKNYVSKYFDNDLYEYTELPDDNYTYRLVRVFDTADELIDFVDSIKCSLHGNKYYIDEYIPEFFHPYKPCRPMRGLWKHRRAKPQKEHCTEFPDAPCVR